MRLMLLLNVVKRSMVDIGSLNMNDLGPRFAQRVWFERSFGGMGI